MTYEKTAPTILTIWRKPHQKRNCRSKVIAKKLMLSGSCNLEGEWLKNVLKPHRYVVASSFWCQIKGNR